MIHKKNEEDTTCETTRVWVVLVRGVACWWDGVGEVVNQPVHMPLILPKVPGRFYYYFGKPLEMEGMLNSYLVIYSSECPWKMLLKIIFPS